MPNRPALIEFGPTLLPEQLFGSCCATLGTLSGMCGEQLIGNFPARNVCIFGDPQHVGLVFVLALGALSLGTHGAHRDALFWEMAAWRAGAAIKERARLTLRLSGLALPPTPCAKRPSCWRDLQSIHIAHISVGVVAPLAQASVRDVSGVLGGPTLALSIFSQETEVKRTEEGSSSVFGFPSRCGAVAKMARAPPS